MSASAVEQGSLGTSVRRTYQSVCQTPASMEPPVWMVWTTTLATVGQVSSCWVFFYYYFNLDVKWFNVEKSTVFFTILVRGTRGQHVCLCVRQCDAKFFVVEAVSTFLPQLSVFTRRSPKNNLWNIYSFIYNCSMAIAVWSLCLWCF